MFTKAQLAHMQRMTEALQRNQAYIASRQIPAVPWEEEFMADASWTELVREMNRVQLEHRLLRRIRKVVTQPVDVLSFVRL